MRVHGEHAASAVAYVRIGMSQAERMFDGVEARYNYRLRVNEGQARSLQQVFDACRFVWNTALGRWSDL